VIERVICVVGGGAVAVSFLSSFVSELRRHPKGPQFVIYVLEKSRHLGRGLAYCSDVSSNLLNTRAGFITPFSDKPGHFFQWLQANKHLWEDEFPTVSCDDQAFVPRPLFGLYLESMMAEVVAEALVVGCKIIPVKCEAIDVFQLPSEQLVVNTSSGLSIHADAVLLACGNLQPKADPALEGPKYFASPYPIRRAARELQGASHVGVIGARLSAIDSALGVLASNSCEQVTMVSRSGYLPSVRGTQGRYQPKVLTLPRIMEHVSRHGKLRLVELLGWAKEEIDLAEGRPLSVSELTPPPPEDPLAFLEAEIAAAAKPRPWQAVLYSTNALVDYAWRFIDEADRALWMSSYQSLWMGYRVSIPIENARRLVGYMREGRLSIVRGRVHISRTEEGNFEAVVAHGERQQRFTWDGVMGATGTPRDVTQMDSRLVANLLNRGLARAHPHGGLDVHGETGALIDQEGRVNERILSIGELTSGVFFFTSVLEINARHARLRAQQVFENFIEQNLPQERKLRQPAGA
jgi:uncharacterized NAD(P)/FAD-binding protein YdhS